MVACNAQDTGEAVLAESLCYRQLRIGLPLSPIDMDPWLMPELTNPWPHAEMSNVFFKVQFGIRLSNVPALLIYTCLSFKIWDGLSIPRPKNPKTFSHVLFQQLSPQCTRNSLLRQWHCNFHCGGGDSILRWWLLLTLIYREWQKYIYLNQTLTLFSQV